MQTSDSDSVSTRSKPAGRFTPFRVAALAIIAGGMVLPIRAVAILAMTVAVVFRARSWIGQERATRHAPTIDDYVALSMIRRLAY